MKQAEIFGFDFFRFDFFLQVARFLSATCQTRSDPIELGAMKTATITLLAIAALCAAPGTETFTGTISDDMCARADHSRMRMGSTDAECTTACVAAHGGSYVLYDGKNVYTLTSRQALEKFAGQKVKVIGALDAQTHTIRVDSIAPAR